MKRFSLAVVLVLLFANTTYAGIDRAMNAVCQVGDATGFVFAEDVEQYWLLTAGHCVPEKTQKIAVVFYLNGKRSREHQATVCSCIYNKIHDASRTAEVRDAALLRLAKADFAVGEDRPYIIPFGRLNSVQEGSKIFSAGCPKWSWPNGFIGQVMAKKDLMFSFRPNVIGGRSGSPVFDKDANTVVGMVIWNTTFKKETPNQPLYGYAISLEGIKATGVLGPNWKW